MISRLCGRVLVTTHLVQSEPISRVLSRTIIPLGVSSPIRSSNLPASDAGHAMDAYLVLLQVGFTVPVCYQTRGALLPHRFTLTTHLYRPFGGLLSVALSVGSHRPGVTWHFALRSPDFPPLHQSEDLSAATVQLTLRAHSSKHKDLMGN